MLLKRVGNRKELVYGFPQILQDDVLVALNVIPKKAYINWDMSEEVLTYTLFDDIIKFPYRVYFYEPTTMEMYSLTEQQQTILHCIYSRSHVGYIREKHIASLLSIDFPEWAIPYLVKVCDEYVKDILQVVYENLRGKNTEHIKQFCADNHESFCKSYNRMISYWNAYYRNDCYKFENYIGRKLFIECFGAKCYMNSSK